MKTEQVNEILKDLYAIDPSLKEYDEKLKKIIFEIYYNKPEIELNADFKEELKKKVLDKIYEIKRNTEMEKNIAKNKKPNKDNFVMIMKKINYILAGGVATAFVFGAVLYFVNPNGLFTNKNSSIADEMKTVNFKLSINNSKDNFGQLFTSDTANGAVNINPSAPMAASVESTRTVASAPAGLAIGGGGSGTVVMDATVNSKMISLPYTPTTYKYVYNGETNFLDNLTEDDLLVLKRDKSSSVAFDNNSGLINLSDINISKFSNLKINNLSIDEDKEYGYSLYVSPVEGTLSISKNWTKWPQQNYDKALTVDDVPQNDALISAATGFVNNYNIGLENYSTPHVQNDYRILYAQTEDKTNFYFPTISSVVFPLVINNKAVYEQYGDEYGITVGIDLKENKVESVYNIQTLKYESAKYDINKDIATILKVAENTDNYYYGPATDMKLVTLELKDPKIAYTRIYKYENNSSDEYLVPAVVFTVNDTDNILGAYGRKRVVVPLTKEYIDEALQRIKDVEDSKTNATTNPESGTSTGGTGSIGASPTLMVR